MTNVWPLLAWQWAILLCVREMMSSSYFLSFVCKAQTRCHSIVPLLVRGMRERKTMLWVDDNQGVHYGATDPDGDGTGIPKQKLFGVLFSWLTYWVAEIFCLCFLEGAAADGVNYDTKIMVKRPLLCMDERFGRWRWDWGDNNWASSINDKLLGFQRRSYLFWGNYTNFRIHYHQKYPHRHWR